MKRTGRKIVSLLYVACLLMCLLFVPSDRGADAAARDPFLSQFMQTVYNQESGLGSTEVNCILQTASGYIYAGTDGGFYRYNGKEFKILNLWDTDKDDVYFVKDLFQDSRERLWISTNNYGLFYMLGSEVHHFSSDYYDGIKSINDVCEGKDGIIYVAGSEGLYIADPSAETLQPVAALAGKNIKQITVAGSILWGIDNDNHFFSLNEAEQVMTYSADKYTEEELSCILGMEDGTVYFGTTGMEVIHLKQNMEYSLLTSTRDGISSLYYDGSRLFVCAEGGVGYFNTEGKFSQLNDTDINRYFTSMIMDYEGNYWFSSSRFGILMLGRSKFQSFNERYGLNAIGTNCVRNFGVWTCICTDEGLTILDAQYKTVKNDLTEFLKGASVKDIMRDSKGNFWISTSRRYGIVRYSPAGEIKTFGRTGSLLTNLVNTAIELHDGTIAVATEEGISILDGDSQVLKNYSRSEGLEYSNINCLYEDADGRLFAGSDGGGLYVIEGDRVRNLTESDGLTSNVITSITPGKSGLWISTDNGVSLFSESIRAISNIDFSNNVYDILTEDTEDGEVIWIIGSKGVLRTTEEELLGTTGVSGRYYAQGDGLKMSLTLYSHSTIKDHIIYLCCEQGVYMFHTDSIPENTTAPRLTVSEINVDDTVYHFDQIGGSLKIPSNTQRMSISFAVLSYTNRENIKVEYKLEGFDSTPITISPSDPMQAVYTNLEGGSYTFTVRAMNGDGVSSEEDITFRIEKEYGFFEKTSVKILLLSILVLLVLSVIIGLIWFQRRVSGQNREIEKLEKEHEVAVKSSTAKTDFLAHMSNEIKTPIHAIISLAETLQHEENRESREQSLKAIVDSGEDILGKVDETIQLARLEAGKETAQEAPYSITTLVCDISDSMINRLADRPVRFLVDLGENIPDIMIGDYDKIKRILEILTDNAQKYTQEGTITLFVDCYHSMDAKGKDTLFFSISDTGVGIRKERLQHIFEVYNIADSKKQTGYTGSGISLAIAKKLTEIMDGELDVESTYGAGSTFTLSLRQGKPEGDVVPVSTDAEILDRVTKEEAEKMLLSDVNVLLVDDIEIGRTVALGVLKQMEAHADAASSGVSAVDMVMNKSYDLVFMDLAMPVMSGEDALHEIRELERDGVAELPILAMTEDAIREDYDRLIETGFTDVIVKPLDLVTLATVAKKYLPAEKIRYRSVNLTGYTNESRYREGLEILQGHLDVAGTLERIGGSVEVYNRILSTFFNQNQNAPEELQTKFTKNYRAFRTRLHSVRTGAQNVGAVEIVNLISRLDAAININNRGYVRDNLPSLIRMLDGVLVVVAHYLEFAVGQQGIVQEKDPAFMPKEPEETMEKEPKEEGREQKRPAPETAAKKKEPVLHVTKKKEPVLRDSVDPETLRLISEKAKAKDIEGIAKELERLASDRYGNEDTEFLQALADQAREKNTDAILDMIDTYIALKKG